MATATPLLPDIKTLQTQLNANGANLQVDGIFGPLTQAAQTQYGSLIKPITPTIAPSTTILANGNNVATPANVNSITSTALGASPVVTPTIPAQTSVVGGIDYLSSITAQNKAALEAANQAQLDAAKTNVSESSNFIKDIYNKLSGQATKKNDLYAAGGVDIAKQQVDEFTSQLEAEQLAVRRQTDEIKNNNAGGLLESGQQAIVNDLNTKSLSKQADLAILQNNALRKYSTAKDIADRQIEAETEQLKTALDAMKFFYQENKDTFDKAEQRQWDSAIKQQDREYQQTVEDKKVLSQTKLDLLKSASSQGASIAVQKAIQAATTPEAALLAAGQYAGDILDRKLKIAQINSANRANQPSAADKIVKINGVDYVRNSDGSFSLPKVPTSSASATSSLNQIDTVNSLLTNTKGLKAAVGTTGLFGRGGNLDFGAAKQNFNSTVQQLTSQLTLDKLINAKANGATFGALSEGELGLLTASSTKLNTYAIKDKAGNITGFKTSEKNVKKELDTIANLAKKDYVLKGGDPATIGATSQPDGTIWVMNSDGSFSQIL